MTPRRLVALLLLTALVLLVAACSTQHGGGWAVARECADGLQTALDDLNTLQRENDSLHALLATRQHGILYTSLRGEN